VITAAFHLTKVTLLKSFHLVIHQILSNNEIGIRECCERQVEHTLRILVHK